jgi:glycosidase
MKKTILLFFLLTSFAGYTQSGSDIDIQKVEPPFWWTGMENPDLQLLVYGKGIGLTTPSIEYPGLVLVESKTVENQNYLFLRLKVLPECSQGTFELVFSLEGEAVSSWNYELKSRKAGSAARKGFDRTDVLYLLLPDRFSNGNPANDNAKNMVEPADRSNPDGRHGGDIQGIMNHLDYLSASGFTGVWINPLLENNNPEFSYHGYAATDFYKVDPRFGTNASYLNLVNACHQRGLKVVMDVIFNHCSVHHWLIKDLPSPEWIHQFDEYTPSNFRASTLPDPHASEFDKKRMLTGWFDRHMADLNQLNPLLATYLIQNSIWWIEYSGIDGIRIDTQPYPYKSFISKWGEAVFKEYPNFNVVGEAWLQKEAFTAYFQKGSPNRDGYNSNIPSVTDFPLYYALNEAFKEEETWTEGILRIYYVLAHDHLYGDPYENLIFLDNHDLTRFYTAVEEDFDRWKMAMAVLATMRGIPCIYYGTELLMTGDKELGHGKVREDFPGGWSEDLRNAFTREGRTAEENKAYDFMKRLLTWRKEQEVIHHGKFKHFVPEDNVYVYFRYNGSNCIMVALNNNDHELKALDHEKFKECLEGYTFGKNVITGEVTNYLDAFTVPPKSPLILELKK